MVSPSIRHIGAIVITSQVIYSWIYAFMHKSIKSIIVALANEIVSTYTSEVLCAVAKQSACCLNCSRVKNDCWETKIHL